MWVKRVQVCWLKLCLLLILNAASPVCVFMSDWFKLGLFVLVLRPQHLNVDQLGDFTCSSRGLFCLLTWICSQGDSEGRFAVVTPSSATCQCWIWKWCLRDLWEMSNGNLPSVGGCEETLVGGGAASDPGSCHCLQGCPWPRPSPSCRNTAASSRTSRCSTANR